VSERGNLPQAGPLIEGLPARGGHGWHRLDADPSGNATSTADKGARCYLVEVPARRHAL
jgi:hypothetical protein